MPNNGQIEVDGTTYRSMRAAAIAYGVPYQTFKTRFNAGLRGEQLRRGNRTGKSQGYGTPVTVCGVEYPSIAAACRAHGVDRQTCNYRMNTLGWTLEEAITGDLRRVERDSEEERASGLRMCAACKRSKPLDAFWVKKEHRASSCKECADVHRRARTYKLSHEEMRAKQAISSCELCGSKAARGKGKRFHIDHCHKTGKVRGVLCSNCNKGIGHFKDDPALVRRVADYLEKGSVA